MTKTILYTFIAAVIFTGLTYKIPHDRIPCAVPGINCGIAGGMAHYGLPHSLLSRTAPSFSIIWQTHRSEAFQNLLVWFIVSASVFYVYRRTRK